MKMFQIEVEKNSTLPFNNQILDITGYILSFLFVMCFLVNAILLKTFTNHKELRNTLNTLVIILTGFNLFGCIQFPFVASSSFSHK